MARVRWTAPPPAPAPDGPDPADPDAELWVTDAEQADVRGLVVLAEDLDDDDPALMVLHARYGLRDYDTWGPGGLPAAADRAVHALAQLRRRAACWSRAESTRHAQQLAVAAGLGWA